LSRAAALGADHVINYSHDPDWGRTARRLFSDVGDLLGLVGPRSSPKRVIDCHRAARQARTNPHQLVRDAGC
jgi:hypothetical protein